MNDLKQVLTQKQHHAGEWIIEKTLAAAGIASVLFISLIFIFLFKEGIQFFNTVSPMDLIGKWVYDTYDEKYVYKIMWQAVSEVPKYSLIPLICGSFLVAFPATIIASIFGIGVAAGVYDARQHDHE